MISYIYDSPKEKKLSSSEYTSHEQYLRAINEKKGRNKTKYPNSKVDPLPPHQ